MRAFIEKCPADIKFYEHKYRIHCRSISHEERAKMRTTTNLSGTTPLTWCGYADDLVLFLESRDCLSKATELLDQRPKDLVSRSITQKLK